MQSVTALVCVLLPKHFCGICADLVLQCDFLLYYWLANLNLDLMRRPVQSLAVQFLVMVQRQQWCELGWWWGTCMGETLCFASCAGAACRAIVWPPQLWPLWDSWLDADFSLIASFSSDYFFFVFCLFEKILSMICQLWLWRGKNCFPSVLHCCRLWGR